MKAIDEVRVRIRILIGRPLFEEIRDTVEEMYSEEDEYAVEHAVLLCLANKLRDEKFTKAVLRFRLEDNVEPVTKRELYHQKMGEIYEIVSDFIDIDRDRDYKRDGLLSS